MELKRELLNNARHLADMKEDKHKLESNHTLSITKNDYDRFKMEILQK